MAPVAIASLATLAGLFTVLDARSADQSLALAGFRYASLLTARLTVVTLLALLAKAASLTVTATVFDARQWGLCIAANTLIALTYALIGVLICPLFGGVGGALIAFLVPFLDIGIEQSPMLHPQPPAWATPCPATAPDAFSSTPHHPHLRRTRRAVPRPRLARRPHAAAAIMFRRTAAAPR
ncbi:hypothetical protein [Streptomyces sp.]|uniref:hypothetical protein n=1 Tax=Streptomyces sp. TaxID=1931 RepID=UPI002D7870F8|nr:hypothetical protein [Streptomyces sp.]HET6358046.1 hypothetical protein [Streptomyces sp.]